MLVHPLITTFQKKKGEHYLIRIACRNLALNNPNNLEILLIKAEQRRVQKITSLIVDLSKWINSILMKLFPMKPKHQLNKIIISIDPKWIILSHRTTRLWVWTQLLTKITTHRWTNQRMTVNYRLILILLLAEKKVEEPMSAQVGRRDHECDQAFMMKAVSIKSIQLLAMNCLTRLLAYQIWIQGKQHKIHTNNTLNLLLELKIRSTILLTSVYQCHKWIWQLMLM